MYYNMRCKTIWRQFTEMEGKLKDLLVSILKTPNNRIRSLVLAVKDVRTCNCFQDAQNVLNNFAFKREFPLKLERESRKLEADLGRPETNSDSDKEERVIYLFFLLPSVNSVVVDS